jgi:hypothetical protein
MTGKGVIAGAESSQREVSRYRSKLLFCYTYCLFESADSSLQHDSSCLAVMKRLQNRGQHAEEQQFSRVFVVNVDVLIGPLECAPWSAN